MNNPTLLKHLRDVLILPFTVTVIIPYAIYNPGQNLLPEMLIIKIIGFFFMLMGLFIFTYTVMLFNNIGRGTLAPWSPKEKLVIAGPYRYCRNPMITGVLSILLAESLLLDSANILIWAGGFFLINNIYFLISEEPGLQSRFGNDYTVYKKNVPRWIPRFTPFHNG